MKLVVILFNLFIFSAVQAGEIYRGGKETNSKVQVSPIFCMAGGGGDAGWIDGWRTLLLSAPKGDIVIVQSYPGKSGYEEWLLTASSEGKLPEINSVTTLAFTSREDSEREDFLKATREAEVVFFVGGDQTLYIDWFKDTPFHKIIEDRLRTGDISLAGTSAGMAIMSSINYTGRHPSPVNPKQYVSSSDVLENPLGDFVELSSGLMQAPFLAPLVTETHFRQRRRQGRLIGFMARAQIDGMNKNQPIRGIGIDERTSFCYNEGGLGRVYGLNKVYFLKSTQKVEAVLPGKGFTWKGNEDAIDVTIMEASDSPEYFDLKRWMSWPHKSETISHEVWWVDNLTYIRRSVDD